MRSHADSLSTRDLNRLCSLIHKEAGISITPEKKIMLEGRLKRRMTALKIHSFGDYCKYLFDGTGHDSAEMVHLIDAVSTNKTDFYREKEHFDLLTAKILPELAARNRYGRELLIWSAGCSTGEEPYTLAIVLSEYARSHPGFRFRVLATDISTAVLAKAEQAIYAADVVKPVPPEQRRRYFMRSRNREANLVRVVPELRELVEFRRLNLMEEFQMAERADAVFCRNVIIYFDRPTQEKLFRKFARQLVEGGYIFVGHSESLHHMDVPLIAIAPALYRKADARTSQ